MFLLKKLAAKQVVALKLENFKLRTDVGFGYCAISFHTLENGRKFASLNVHYGPIVESVHYYDLEMAIRDFTFILDVYKSQSNEQIKKADNA